MNNKRDLAVHSIDLLTATNVIKKSLTSYVLFYGINLKPDIQFFLGLVCILHKKRYSRIQPLQHSIQIDNSLHC